MGYLSKTDAIDARVLSHFAFTLYQSDRRDRLLMKLPDANQEALEAWVTRRVQRIQMRVAEENRLVLSNKTQRKSIATGRKVIDKELARIEQEMEGPIKEHFADKQALFEACKGVASVTVAGLMGKRPELGELNQKEIGKLVGVAPLNGDSEIGRAHV